MAVWDRRRRGGRKGKGGEKERKEGEKKKEKKVIVKEKTFVHLLYVRFPTYEKKYLRYYWRSLP